MPLIGPVQTAGRITPIYPIIPVPPPPLPPGALTTLEILRAELPNEDDEPFKSPIPYYPPVVPIPPISSHAYVRQWADNYNQSAFTATFPSPCINGSTVIACLIGLGTVAPPTMDAVGPGGFTLLSGTGVSRSQVPLPGGYIQTRIYGRQAYAGLQVINRVNMSVGIVMTILEIVGVNYTDIADTDVISNQPMTDPMNFSIGNLSGRGMAISVSGYGRSVGAPYQVATTPGPGWTQLSSRGANINGDPSNTGWWTQVQYMNVAFTASTPAEHTADQIKPGQGFLSGGGVAILLNSPTP